MHDKPPTMSVPRLSNEEILTFLFIHSHHPLRPRDLDRYPTIMKFLKEDKCSIQSGYIQPIPGIVVAEEAFQNVVPRMLTEQLHGIPSNIEVLEKAETFIDVSENPSFQFSEALQLRVELLKTSRDLQVDFYGRLSTRSTGYGVKGAEMQSRILDYNTKYVDGVRPTLKLAR